MLASAADYFFQPWEIPIWIVISFVSLMLGGYFISSGIQKTGLVKKMSLGLGILAMFIIGSISAFFALIVYRVCMEMMHDTITFVGMAGAAATFTLMFYMMMWAWQKKMSTTEIYRVCLLPVATVLLISAFVATPTIIFAYNSRQKNIKEGMLIKQSMQNLQDIFSALRERGVDRPPVTLDVLAKEKLIDAEKLKSPANSNRAIGFFYLPTELSYSNREENEYKIIACDYKDNFGRYRVVLYATGKLQTLSEPSFQDSLQNPVNKNFKQALQKLENAQ